MAANVKWNELFPTKWSFVIFVAYVGFFTNQGILVRWTQLSDNSYAYSTINVVLFTDLIKLTLAGSLFLKDHTFDELFKEVYRNSRVCMLYLIPAFLYTLYNNIAFISLSAFDPTTYYLLLQLRVVLTGLIYQLIFHRFLSRKQWISLCLLSVGCMIKEMDFSNVNSLFAEITKKETSLLLLLFQVGFIELQIKLGYWNSWLIQVNFIGCIVLLLFLLVLDYPFCIPLFGKMSCSCIAGVYNEYLLKKESDNANIFVQNIFMYVNSIVCNLLMVLWNQPLSEAFSHKSMSAILVPSVIILMLNNAAGGITTSFFLRNLNSIMKTFTGAMEMTASAILCYIFFGIPIYLNTVISIAIVSYATILYAHSPISIEKESGKDRDPLLV